MADQQRDAGVVRVVVEPGIEGQRQVQLRVRRERPQRTPRDDRAVELDDRVVEPRVAARQRPHRAQPLHVHRMHLAGGRQPVRTGDRDHRRQVVVGARAQPRLVHAVRLSTARAAVNTVPSPLVCAQRKS